MLPDDLLERCARRTAGYDRKNRIFFGDFDELRQAKYLLTHLRDRNAMTAHEVAGKSALGVLGEAGPRWG